MTRPVFPRFKLSFFLLNLSVKAEMMLKYNQRILRKKKNKKKQKLKKEKEKV